MMYLSSTDIDLLVHDVREPESRRLILEAITAYRSGALRSAIISTWIASVFDIFAKLRELASLGESAAIVFVKELDEAIEKRNIAKLQKIETTLLEESQKIVNIFSQQDLQGLKRLQEDRNQCAHPAMIENGSLYDITPEQVRAHIVYVLKNLLIQAPLQGKSAILRFENDLLGKSFPLDSAEIELYLKQRYVDKAKDSLVISLIKGIFIAPFGSEHARFSGKTQLLAKSFKALSDLKTHLFESEMKSFVANYLEGVSEDRLLFICPFIKVDRRVWDWAGESTRIKIRMRIQNSTPEELRLACAYDALYIHELAETLLKKFPTNDSLAATDIVSASPSPQLVSVAIQTYQSSASYRMAERLGQSIIIPLTKFFTVDSICEILRVAQHNRQINQASGTEGVLQHVFNETSHLFEETKQHWEAFFTEMDGFGNQNFLELQDVFQARVNGS